MGVGSGYASSTGLGWSYRECAPNAYVMPSKAHGCLRICVHDSVDHMKRQCCHVLQHYTLLVFVWEVLCHA